MRIAIEGRERGRDANHVDLEGFLRVGAGAERA